MPRAELMSVELNIRGGQARSRSLDVTDFTVTVDRGENAAIDVAWILAELKIGEQRK